MGYGVSSQRSICSTETSRAIGGWIIPGMLHKITKQHSISLTPPLTHSCYMIGREDSCECQEGSRFGQPWNSSVFGIGYFSSFPSSCIRISGFPFPFRLYVIWLKRQNQDKSHYVDVDTYRRSAEQIKRTDQMKKELALQKGITLIPIPCWWDGTKSR